VPARRWSSVRAPLALGLQVVLVVQPTIGAVRQPGSSDVIFSIS
jgi:hypothetical protein